MLININLLLNKPSLTFAIRSIFLASEEQEKGAIPTLLRSIAAMTLPLTIRTHRKRLHLKLAKSMCALFLIKMCWQVTCDKMFGKHKCNRCRCLSLTAMK